MWVRRVSPTFRCLLLCYSHRCVAHFGRSQTRPNVWPNANESLGWLSTTVNETGAQRSTFQVSLESCFSHVTSDRPDTKAHRQTQTQCWRG